MPLKIKCPAGCKELALQVAVCAQVEMVSKQHQPLAMPMLAVVLGWQGRVANEPVAAALAHILEKCAERLAALFMRYVQDMVCAPSYRA